VHPALYLFTVEGSQVFFLRLKNPVGLGHQLIEICFHCVFLSRPFMGHDERRPLMRLHGYSGE
jgi:hypothetical protein